MSNFIHLFEKILVSFPSSSQHLFLSLSHYQLITPKMTNQIKNFLKLQPKLKVKLLNQIEDHYCISFIVFGFKWIWDFNNIYDFLLFPHNFEFSMFIFVRISNLMMKILKMMTITMKMMLNGVSLRLALHILPNIVFLIHFLKFGSTNFSSH